MLPLYSRNRSPRGVLLHPPSAPALEVNTFTKEGHGIFPAPEVGPPAAGLYTAGKQGLPSPCSLVSARTHL